MKKEKLKQRNNRGITLIALIITVIVMLILAGVAINMTIGDNGIFKKSDAGAKIYKNAANNEAIGLNSMDKEMGDLMNQIESSNQENPMEIVSVVQVGTNVYALTKSGELRETTIEEGNIFGKIKLGNVVESFQGKKIVKVMNDLNNVNSDVKYMALDNTGKVYVGDTDRIITINEQGGLQNTKFTDMYATNGSYIARDEEGKLYTWGNNWNGELGNGTTENSSVPSCISDTGVLQGVKIIDVCFDGTTVIARDEEGKLYTWGNNSYGELGNGTTGNSNVPICISNTGVLQGVKIVDVCFNGITVIARDEAGKLYTWGWNGYGQLGNGTIENSSVPICISDTGVLQGVKIVDVYADGETVIARDEVGKLYTWGWNGYGELGNGTTEDSSVPICISDTGVLQGVKIVDICADGNTILARDNNGKVYAWGNNEYGQLGNGTTGNSNVPICISEIENSELKDKGIRKVLNGYWVDFRCIVYISKEESYIYQYEIIRPG